MGGYVLIVRPEPGLAATLAAAQEMGLNAIGYPLFEIRACDWICPDSASFDALLIGSANAVRHGGEALSRMKDKPVYAVGETTAKTAQGEGFTIASTGTGGLQNVLDAVPPSTRLLRIAGAEHVPLNVPAGVFMQTIIAYESVPLELPEPLRPLQDLGLTVLLHSAAAAKQFASESRRLAFNRGRITLAVIGPRVAQAAGDGWGAVHVSPKPNDRAMLEMVRDMCI